MASHIERRKFLATLGGAVAAWPLAARAQDRVRQIGILFSGFSDTHPEPRARMKVFAQQLQELGWTDGGNIRIHVRIGAGKPDRVRSYAAELAAMKPNVHTAGICGRDG
jgi:putative tryptophan/tyrosine transport system substrate-binding protein